MADITTAFVQQFQGNVEHLVQQQGSRLRSAVRLERVTGEKAFFDQLGKFTVTQSTSRNADTPLVDGDHARRMVRPKTYQQGTLIDDADQVQMLANLDNPYAEGLSYAIGRQMDLDICAAAVATSSTGKTGSGSESFPSGSEVAVDYADGGGGSTNTLTLAKVREAKRILDSNEVPSNDRFFATSAYGLMSLLRDTTLTSADYNAIKPLVSGELDSFLGFKFIQTEQLTVASNIRDCLAWQRNGIVLAEFGGVNARISERSDKNYSTQVFIEQTFGSTRMEGERVVRIKVNETK